MSSQAVHPNKRPATHEEVDKVITFVAGIDDDWRFLMKFLENISNFNGVNDNNILDFW